MAKKQPKGNGGNQKNSGGGRAGSVTENIKSTEAARERNSKEARMREDQRRRELETGTFYARLNEGRSTDLLAAIRGEPGTYAFPGGNVPSLHYSVSKEIVGDGKSIMVIRFEVAQRGHELEGQVFDPKVFLPCYAVEKYGVRYQSRSKDAVAKATQELIATYMAVKLDELIEAHEAEIGPLASDNLSGILDEVEGVYRASKDGKNVFFEVFRTQKSSNVRIMRSEAEDLVAGRAFVQIHFLKSPELLKVTDDETYAAQCAIHSFLRGALKAELESPAEGDKPVGKKELEKKARQRDAKIEDANERADAETTLHNMRKALITPMEALYGKLGYVEMSHLTGECIILFAKNGNDNVAQVAYLSEKHMLRLTGVKVDMYVFGGQVMAGKIDRHDYGVNKMSKEDITARTALIGYIREQFAARGIKFPERKPADLKRVA